MNNKKEIERYELRKFLSNEEMKFLVYKIIDSETPDFEVIINKNNISIEHTKLILQEKRQVEEYLKKIVRLAQNKFNEKYDDDLYVLITFKNKIFEGGKMEEQKYVDEVFQLVESIYLNNKDFEFSIHSKYNKFSITKNIETFSIYNNRKMNHWQTFGAWKVDFIDLKWLEKNIKIKEEKIEKYEKTFYENWLLFIANFGDKSSSLRTDFTDFSEIKSKFDKIFIYSFIEDKVTVVK